MTGYFENKSANNVEADPLMMVLRLADFKSKAKPRTLPFRYKKATIKLIIVA